MIRAYLPSLAVVASTFGLLAAGCAQDDEYDLAVASTTSALEVSQSGGTGKSVFDGINEASCGDPASAANLAASIPTAMLYPAGCETKTTDQSDVHVQFSACTGPFGRRQLNGGLDATFAGCTNGRLHADVVDSGNLTGNGRPIHYKASADVTVDGDTRDVAWTASWSATTRRGRHVEHQSNLDIRIDASQCLDVAGTTAGHVDEFQFGSEIDGLTVCPDRCPSAGTVGITREGRLGERTLTIRFDGSERAHVTGARGRTFDVPLVCSGD
jgi:hypothetical protein